ncbi:hypothetical protein [Psychromonas sp. SP041]|uniref:hypothetical protein n=1 Tax=Psychromonas sp. SP041 TaxID=1365007 RepID=UPI0010C7E00E|nr:hypothetical protein [Psychromonas sp. SP041]
MANHSNKPRPRFITVTPLGEFASLTLAAESELVTPMAISKKLNNSANTRYYRKYPGGVIDLGAKKNRDYKLDRKNLIGTVVITPKGQFDTAKDAAFAEGISPCTMTCRIKNDNYPDFYRIELKEVNKTALKEAAC